MRPYTHTAVVPGLVPGTQRRQRVAIPYDGYFLANRQHGTLTIDFTNDVARHARKIRLIERDNPDWDDLYDRANG